MSFSSFKSFFIYFLGLAGSTSTQNFSALLRQLFDNIEKTQKLFGYFVFCFFVVDLLGLQCSVKTRKLIFLLVYLNSFSSCSGHDYELESNHCKDLCSFTELLFSKSRCHCQPPPCLQLLTRSSLFKVVPPSKDKRSWKDKCSCSDVQRRRCRSYV